MVLNMNKSIKFKSIVNPNCHVVINITMTIFFFVIIMTTIDTPVQHCEKKARAFQSLNFLNYNNFHYLYEIYNLLLSKTHGIIIQVIHYNRKYEK